MLIDQGGILSFFREKTQKQVGHVISSVSALSMLLLFLASDFFGKLFNQELFFPVWQVLREPC